MTLDEAVKEIGRLHKDLIKARKTIAHLEGQMQSAREHLVTAADIIERQREQMVTQRKNNEELADILRVYRDTRTEQQKRLDSYCKHDPGDGPSGRSRHD